MEKTLKKYALLLNDEDFGKLVKCFLHYKEHRDIPEDTESRTEQLFRTTLQKKCDKQFKNTEIQRKRRKETKKWKK